jgi:hypothetical protein
MNEEQYNYIKQTEWEWTYIPDAVKETESVISFEHDEEKASELHREMFNSMLKFRLLKKKDEVLRQIDISEHDVKDLRNAIVEIDGLIDEYL